MSENNRYQAVTQGEDNRWEIMTSLYYEKLEALIAVLELENRPGPDLTVRHFFNGAAAYANGKICASWSPVGLAFKLSAEETAELIANGQARPLKYFAKSPIKKGYALFDRPDSSQRSKLRAYFLKAATLACADDKNA